MDTDGQLRNLRDFLLVYNRMTEICFQRCTTNFNYRNLTMDEEHCVDNCAGKLIRSNHRLMGTYVKLMPAMVQRRMEEMESKAAKAAEAAAPLDGNLGTPEATPVMPAVSPMLAANHAVTTDVPEGSVSFPTSTSESTLLSPSFIQTLDVPLTFEPVTQVTNVTIPSVSLQTADEALIPPLIKHAQNSAAQSTQISSELSSPPGNLSIPAQGFLSNVAAGVTNDKLAPVSIDNSNTTSSIPGLQSSLGTKQDKTS